MQPGLNHNVRFKGKIYHVQTEDSGVQKPHIITVLYSGGAILAKKRTSYADMVASEHLGDVVRDIMRNQHKDMLRLLKSGDLEGERGTPVEAVGDALPVPAVPPVAAAADEISDEDGSLDEVILDFMTGDSGKRRPSGGTAG